MTVTLTESAARQIRAQLAKRGRGIGLRLGVKKVGCSGYGYHYDYADAVGDADSTFEAHEAKLVVDRDSLAFLDGATVDFVRDGLKQTFKIDNPNVDAACGCGESFSMKAAAGEGVPS